VESVFRSHYGAGFHRAHEVDEVMLPRLIS